MNRINTGTINESYAEAIRLHYKKDRTMEDAFKESAIRRENPALDQMLYDSDKADIFKEMFEAKGLLAKLARGEELTEQEKKFLEENYPGFIDQAYEKVPATEQEDQAEQLRRRFEQQMQQFSLFDVTR